MNLALSFRNMHLDILNWLNRWWWRQRLDEDRKLFKCGHPLIFIIILFESFPNLRDIISVEIIRTEEFYFGIILMILLRIELVSYHIWYLSFITGCKIVVNWASLIYLWFYSILRSQSIFSQLFGYFFVKFSQFQIESLT